MAGLVSEGFVLALQVGLPGFELIEQSIEVVAQVIQLGDVGRRHALIERPLATGGVSHGARLRSGPVIPRSCRRARYSATQH